MQAEAAAQAAEFTAGCHEGRPLGRMNADFMSRLAMHGYTDLAMHVTALSGELHCTVQPLQLITLMTVLPPPPPSMH